MNKMNLETVLDKFYDVNANKELETAEANIKNVVNDIANNISDYSVNELESFIYSIVNYMNYVYAVNLIKNNDTDYDTYHEQNFISAHDDVDEDIIYSKKGLEEYLIENNLLDDYKDYILSELKDFTFIND